jgi:hypothetical protein
MPVLRTIQAPKAMDLQDGNRPPEPVRASEANGSIELLPDIQFGEYRERSAEIRDQIECLQVAVSRLEQEIERLSEGKMLAAKSQPGLAPAISASIHDSRDSMVDALYPIMGRLIARALFEAMRRLAQRIAGPVHKLFNRNALTLRMSRRSASVSQEELPPRDGPLLLKTMTVVDRRSQVTAPFRRYDPEFRLAPATTVMVWLVILVFLLVAWRLWHAFSGAPVDITAIAGLFLFLYNVEQDAPGRFWW